MDSGICTAVKDAEALSRRITGKIRRTQNAVILKDIVAFAAETVIARCDDICAACEKLLRRLPRDAVALCGVFAVDDDQISAVLPAEYRCMLLKAGSSRFSDNITEHQYLHEKPPFQGS